jgi:hypothetical protein
MPVPSQGHYVFTVFRLLTDFVCLYTYEFWLSLCKIVGSSVILLLPLFREKHSQTVTPPPSNAVVPTLRSCRNAVFLSLYMRSGHQLDSTKNDFHPTSVLSATTWYSIPYGHMPNEAWLFCGILSVADVLSVTKSYVVKTSVDGPSANASVDNLSASQRVRIAE